MMAHAFTEFSGDFFMLGIIHRDDRNPEIVRTWLGKIRPDVITIEISRYSVDFRLTTGKVYRERLDGICSSLSSKERGRTELNSFYSFIGMPSEFLIADDYCRRNNIGVYPVDMDLFSFLKLRRMDEMIDRENILKNVAEDERPRTTEQVLADLYFHNGVTAFSYDKEMEIRDNYMSHKIGVLRKRYKSGRFLHIAGWQHLRDPLSLYDPFKPVKIYPYD